jgi:rhodanese-related sulfurtransferase
MASVPARMTELDASAAIACLCHHGGRSQQVALFLAHQGRTSVANIAGGIHVWAVDVDTSIPRY